MTLRLRLVLWYGALSALTLLMVTTITYAAHARGLYDDLDRALIITTGHQAQMVAGGDVRLMQGGGGFQIFLRRYDASGRLLSAPEGNRLAPPVNPLSALAHPGGPAYPAIAALVPMIQPLAAAPNSAFSTLTTPEGRWRVYVAPIVATGQVTGYVEGLTSLAQVDAGLARLAQMLAIISVTSLIIMLLGSCLVVRSALRTVGRLTDTAHAIAESRDLSQRITTTGAGDEIGRLATTFNEMLSSLHLAATAQQRFVSDASHELRAPLTALQANLDLVSRHPELDADARAEALGEADREAGRMARLVADLLALARADAGVALRRQPVELDALALEVFQTARKLAHGQELALEEFEPVVIMGDEDRLKQLVLILVDNALKYTPKGGRVTLGLRHRASGSDMSQAASAVCAEIIVRDTGVGIPAEALPHVFERFYRADPARRRDPGGTGLGLAIARWIAEQHGGDITIESAPGVGTTATIQLPIPTEASHTTAVVRQPLIA
ncbi:MAG TPA: HAMP domain-containing sensor histidine kinase [Ktedonobacterales bacterium]|jgi:signal transduction histidine kinase|nr:HAMP domain-containing sensor histidine kinase [Ktedonobacterales bacterium]